ncbi:trypsin-like peptidase domain-containing protein [Anatilimnocola floriformis]|uniref:trypsin-like peptidase domain-containing protein n=1 Tax=Anatilimnocola floriformis TaxID=2948575 RepID=UPI0020C3BFF0|nr:trypsin-like peptidase domain-containing protein [Anatilimnocola floriformis]
MDLSKNYQEFTEALLSAFDADELTMLVRFKLDINLDNVVGPGPLKKRVFELIGHCDHVGIVDKLFVEALRERPGNPKLKALAQKLDQEIKSSQQVIESKVVSLLNKDYENPKAAEVRAAYAEFDSNGGLQAVVVRAPHLKVGQDVENFVKRMASSRTKVCSIAGKMLGTGFLIGPDRIITNSHVIAEQGTHTEFDVVFDFVEGTNREDLPKYKFVKELARSGPKEFDYVILQLDRTPDKDRGYFKVRNYQFDKLREPVSVLGHPLGNPLSLAFGVVFDVDSFMGRVAYSANTAGGSSGSPVFLENWDLAALHHHGEENINNHGIPMRQILKDLRDKNLPGLIETID